MPRALEIGLSVIVTLQFAGCSTVPPLSDVTNNAPFGTRISVDDVVKRVKCELADALRHRMEEPSFRWIESWTAKADLTLQVNESGSITPSVTFIEPLHNAYPLGSGPSSVSFPAGNPGNSVGAASQNFNFGVGAVYSGQVFRTETVSFALSLRELKQWRENGSGKGFPCTPAGATDLQGNLDLEPWISEALMPIALGDLSLGIHPDPGSKPAAASAAGGTKAFAQPAPAIQYYRDAAKNAAGDATKSAQAAWATLRQAERSKVLDSRTKLQIADLANKAAQAAIWAQDAHQKADAADNEEDARKSAVSADRNAEAAALDAAAAKTAANPDPPIDSISHSLNFVVTIGGNVSPNWALLHWKGPATLGNLASSSGIRTHTLSIALGAPAAPASSEVNRVLDNNAFRQSLQSPF